MITFVFSFLLHVYVITNKICLNEHLYCLFSDFLYPIDVNVKMFYINSKFVIFINQRTINVFLTRPDLLMLHFIKTIRFVLQNYPLRPLLWSFLNLQWGESFFLFRVEGLTVMTLRWPKAIKALSLCFLCVFCCACTDFVSLVDIVFL